jgi:hypothetical protein
MTLMNNTPQDAIQLFEGKEIRTLEKNGETWIPIRDLSTAWGLNRTTLYNHIKRNERMFQDCTMTCDNLSQPGFTDVYVNEPGLYLLLARVSTSRIKNASAKESIIRFRIAAPQILRSVRKGEVITPPPIVPPAPKKQIPQKSPSEIAYQASKFANFTKADRRKVTAAMLIEGGYGYLADLLPAENEMPRLPAPSPKPPGFLTASEIADRIGSNAQEVNRILYYRHQFIIRDHQRPGEYRITEAGKQYGVEEYYAPVPGKEVYRVYWSPRILEKFEVG